MISAMSWRTANGLLICHYWDKGRMAS